MPPLTPPGAGRPPRHRTIRRHALPVRLMHWINAICMIVLLMSGLAIFNGWPALYWGIRTHFDHPLLALYATRNDAGHRIGVTDIDGRHIVTTGFLGLSAGPGGKPAQRGFPSWATLPGRLDLALARRWHFFFAWIFVLNGLAYAAYTLLSRHLWRDLVPARGELRRLGAALRDHLLLRFRDDEAAPRYNVLQKLAYLGAIFGLGPLAVATGLAMSPWMDAVCPWLLDIFGGRQSARTIHFVTAFALLFFLLIHLAMVLLAGPVNRMRSMITGRYRIAGSAQTERQPGPGLDRRHLLGRMATGLGALALGAWSGPQRRGWWVRLLNREAAVTEAVQRAITPAGATGRLYTRADISKHFKSNGTHHPRNPEYRKLAHGNFADWRLAVTGLVEHDLSLSLAEIRAMPSVTQITRHDCVEGWSCIGEWTGVPLAHVLARAGVRKEARYVMFFCYDTLPGAKERYYESIALAEAGDPETILAYGMNGQTLPIPHGAPLRLRLGRQLGYKMPKYLRRIELVESFADIGGGHGGFYEDHGYAWYAGI